MTKVFFTTLGCKTNHYDSGAMAGMCAAAGFEIVSDGGGADVHVINTCTVTQAADAQGRNLIRRIIRDNPDATVIVCGCSSQLDADRYKNIEGVAHVLGVNAANELIKILGGGDLSLAHPYVQDRARAFLKIQDGCDDRCAYCAVPAARGPGRSVSPVAVLDEAASLCEAGFREIVLTGVHIGRYGRDLNPVTSLTKLIGGLLSEIGDCRIRISSLDPDEVSRDMIDLISHPRICRHVHFSLQSGCDEILKMMGRKAGAETCARTISLLVSEIAGVAIGADIITGFPGETDRHFDETKRFLNEAPLTYLHVFPYSRRPGTAAASMKDQVPVPIRKERARELLQISSEKRAAFYQSQIGKKLDVIIVSKQPDDRRLVKGISDNYVPVYLPGDGFKYREIYSVDVNTMDSLRRPYP